jgi:zinc transport system substrate-binding protein
MNKTVIIAAVAVIIVGGFVFLLTDKENTPSGNPSEMAMESEKIDVMVSILPQVDFVSRIGGDKVRVTAMIPPGFSPATYEPSPSQLEELQDADIYVRIGHIEFEKARIAQLESLNPDMTVVDSSEGIELLTLAEHSHEEEETYGHEDEEAHEDALGNDPHIWLSPRLVKVQAKHILDALVAYNPDDAAYFTENYDAFITDLDTLDQVLNVAFSPITGETILVFHPAFGYLADAYGFHQESIEIEGKDPTPAQLQNIIDEARADGVKVIFVQEQFSTKSAESVASAIGGAVVQIDPLAPDYVANLKEMAETIVSAF